MFSNISKNKAILGWPILCAAFAIAIWGFTFQKISSERAEAERNAAQLTVSLSKAYSEQLARTVDQIEQVTLNLKYYWNATNSGIDLSDQIQNGLYPPSSQLYVSITDREGNIVTSTLRGPSANLSDREWFKFHQSNPDPTLRIDGELIPGRRSGKSVVRITRRLDTRDGSFNGGITIGVEPSHFASFNDENSLGPRDFISVRHASGALFATKTGASIRSFEQVHLEPPIFNTNSGVKRVSKESYKDSEARVLAWHKLPGYPLVSYVGLSESGLLATHIESANSYRQSATSASFLLAVVALIGMYFSSRLAWRKECAEEINQTYHLAIDAAREGFYMVRPIIGKDKTGNDFVIEDCNERGAEFIGRLKKDLIGKRISEIFQGKPTDSLLSILFVAMDKDFYEDEFAVSSQENINQLASTHPKLTRSNTEQLSWVHRKLVRSKSGLAITLRDITETKYHERSLLDMANTDALTGLPNRHWFNNFLPKAIHNSAQNNSKFAILYIDLDDFKDINDTSGHSTGDQILRSAAVRIQSVLRPQDYVVRIGGDEFTVILSAVFSQEEVAQVANRITQSFHESFEISNRSYLIGASVGISIYPQDGKDAEVLVQNADIAMYAAKEDGKGQSRFYDQRLFECIAARLSAEQELNKAIATEQFVLHYQPKVNSLTGELTGLEALVRWNHPSRGLVFPDEFIPFSEKNGCIVPLGRLIIKMVFEQVRSWHAITGTAMVPVAFNISASQFNDGDLDKLLAASLVEYNVSPDLIEVELTETAMMSDSSMVVDQISAIRRLGLQIHIDDFGTGYSSLSRLQKFDMQVLKIDRAFTSELGNGKEAEILFKTIVLMAKAMNMRVIAEGVETKEQLLLIQDLSCDEVQGYFISRPLPPASILPLFSQRFLIPLLRE